VPECDRAASTLRRPWPTRGLSNDKQKSCKQMVNTLENHGSWVFVVDCVFNAFFKHHEFYFDNIRNRTMFCLIIKQNLVNVDCMTSCLQGIADDKIDEDCVYDHQEMLREISLFCFHRNRTVL
jgi:hypothetical protein